MSIRNFIKRHLVQKLPRRSQLAIERFYLQHFVKNYMETEIRILRQLSDRNKLALDIGANEGAFTLFLSKFSRKVLSFEPVPWLAESLQDKFQDSNVVVENCALGSVQAQMTLHVPIVEGKQVHTRSSVVNDFSEDTLEGRPVEKVMAIEISVMPLDSFNLTDIGFMKIDVEGFEFEVLRGAEKTIRSNMPNLLIEIEERHLKNHCIEDVFQVLKDFGYRGHFMYKGSLRTIDSFDSQHMQDSLRDNTEEYVNDFLFVPADSPEIQL